MQTTTVTAIIDHLIEVIEGITPEDDPTSPGFVRDARAQGRASLDTWAPEAGPNLMFRRFDLKRTAPRQDGGLNNFGARRAATILTLTVCYPAQPKNYGLDDYDALRALIESDGHLLHDRLSSPGGLAGPGHQAVWPDVGVIDEGLESMWFFRMSIEVLLYIAKRSSA